MKPSTAGIKTRLLILSDTHGQEPIAYTAGEPSSNYLTDLHDCPLGFREPLPAADVAIHCGDLTLRSTVPEFEKTFTMLSKLSAPLKLVVAGNHDLAMDRQFWERTLESRSRCFVPEEQAAYASQPDQVDALVKAAEKHGVYLLSEGCHSFDLANGARLKVYASPFTPEYGDWAFQYERGKHEFDMPEGMDVAVTHGPPHGVLDKTTTSEYAGCEMLFDSLYRAKPQVSCFGHIHEGWGAQIVSWKKGPPGDIPCSADDVIDAAKSRFLETPNHRWGAGRQRGISDHEQQRRRKMYEDQCVKVDVTPDGQTPLHAGEETLFVNAAVMDVSYRPTNVPWLVDVALAPVSQQ